MKRQKTCFVISPIGSEDSSTRKRSDKILRHVITPVVAECGYPEAVRADHISTPGMITTQIIERVVEDDLVIADLTELNPNVFYELALRHAVRKPFVHIIEKGHRIPFDVAASRTIEIDHTDLDSVERAKAELKRQILAAEASPDDIDNPISITFDLKALAKSDDPGERSIVELAADITKIGSTLVEMNNKLIGLAKVEKKLNEIQGLRWTSLEDIMDKLGDVESSLDSLETEISDLRE